jgi:hypothetical protein
MVKIPIHFNLLDTMSLNSYLKDLSRAANVMLRPGSSTRRMMDLEEGFSFYYKVSIVPIVLFAFFLLIFGSGIAAFFETVSFVSFFWIIVPLYIIIQSAIIHFVCNFALKEFKRGYYETMAASIYGAVVFMLSSCLMANPAFGPLAFLIALLWGFFTFIVALSNLQKVSRLSALIAVVITYVFESVITVVIMMMLTFGLFAMFSNMLGLMHGITSLKI